MKKNTPSTIDPDQFEGLAKAMEEFNPFTILGSKRDPEWGYEHVHLLFIQFNDGSFGLCIYDTRKKGFIEEPGDLEMYGRTPEEIKTKYGFDFPTK